MQRVIQRSQRASRAAAKTIKKDKAHKEVAERYQRTAETRRLKREITDNIKAARKNRQIDWETGSLAPRRDVGEKAETYGTTTIYNIHLPDRDPEDRIGWSWIDIGDRVVVTKGRERGKIGTVSDMHKKKASVQIKDMNIIDVHVPAWARREEGDDRNIVPVTAQLPIEHVKLVYPLPDPETGVPRDVVIDRVKRLHGSGADGDRVIPGANIIIPRRPTAKPENDTEHYEDDTHGGMVGFPTFQPSLLHPPMPTSIIDELRGKYSKFRTRHDWEYLQKKEQEDERVERRKELGKTMRTPLQELAEQRAAEKQAQRRELTEEQLAKIGEVMAGERERTTRLERQLKGLEPPFPTEQDARKDNVM